MMILCWVYKYRACAIPRVSLTRSLEFICFIIFLVKISISCLVLSESSRDENHLLVPVHASLETIQPIFYLHKESGKDR